VFAFLAIQQLFYFDAPFINNKDEITGNRSLNFRTMNFKSLSPPGDGNVS